jgi:hypothetical protein
LPLIVKIVIGAYLLCALLSPILFERLVNEINDANAGIRFDSFDFFDNSYFTGGRKRRKEIIETHQRLFPSSHLATVIRAIPYLLGILFVILVVSAYSALRVP